MGDVAGAGSYQALLPRSHEVSGFGLRFQLVDLDVMIILKRAAGRPKDLPIIAELQGILERNRSKTP